MGFIFDAMNRVAGQKVEVPAKTVVDESTPVLQDGAPTDDTDTTVSDVEETHLRLDTEDVIVASPDEDNAVIETEPTSSLQDNDEWISHADDRLVTLSDPGSVISEEYRSIRTSLLARWENKTNLVHMITSATPQEGKTITSLNLGLSFAELRARKTIVVEADLRLPTFAKLLPIGDGPGLVGYLRGEVGLNKVVRELSTGLHVISAGGRANNDAVQLLSGSRMTLLLEALRAKYDHVILDTPPVVELADAGILGAVSDDVLLIARMNRTPKPLIEQAVRTLASYNAPVAGVIATDQKRSRRRYYGYRYGYGYRYSYGSTQRKAA